MENLNSTTASIIDTHKEFSLTAQQLAGIACNADLNGTGSDSEHARKIIKATQYQSLIAIHRAQQAPRQNTTEIKLNDLDPEFFSPSPESCMRERHASPRDTLRLYQVTLYPHQGADFNKPNSSDYTNEMEPQQSSNSCNSYPSLKDGFLVFCFSLFGTITAFLGAGVGAQLAEEVGSQLVGLGMQYLSIVFAGLSGGITGVISGLILVSLLEKAETEVKDYFSYRSFRHARRLVQA